MPQAFLIRGASAGDGINSAVIRAEDGVENSTSTRSALISCLTNPGSGRSERNPLSTFQSLNSRFLSPIRIATAIVSGEVRAWAPTRVPINVLNDDEMSLPCWQTRVTFGRTMLLDR